MIYIKKNFTCLIKSVNFKLIVLLFFILVFIYSKEYFENISLIINPFEILMLPGRLFLISNYASYNVEMLSSIIILFLLFIISLISKMIVYFTMKEVSV